jgi:DNA modification methylase
MQEIIQGDCLNVMRTMADNSIDFIVTDPPYGISFMGKQWDNGIPPIEYWQEMLRIIKPGGNLLTFGGTRMFHRLTCLIEDSGFQIRDCLMWLYGSGFPKSHNHFGLAGYGTALKPAWEPIILAMKPCEGTFAQNAEKWGLGGINIDESRIATNDNRARINHIGPGFFGGWGAKNTESHELGRWPSNLLLDEESAAMLDRQTGNNTSRFFYVAKASQRERNEGLKDMPFQRGGTERMNNSNRRKEEIGESERLKLTKNSHPTVKPIALMKYLIKLLSPPGDPLLLDPFAGSGSTLVAAKALGIRSIGIDLSEEYCEIARKRIAHEIQGEFKI